MRRRVVLGVLLSAAVLLAFLAGAALGPRSPAATVPPGHADEAISDDEAGRPAPGGGAPTADSARQAALAYAGASQEWLYLDDPAIDEAIREITTPAAADRLVRHTVDDISVVRDALLHAAGPVWWFVRPLASRITLQEHRARASVWVVTVLSAADVALPQADWLTLEIDLVWQGGRWLLESIEDRPGPTPMSGVRDDPWQPEPFDEALHGFERVGSEVPG